MAQQGAGIGSVEPLPEYQQKGNSGPSQRKKDHRATVQAQKLRMALATQAISHGEVTPAFNRRSAKILLGSVALAAIALVITIGAATVIQML